MYKYEYLISILFGLFVALIVAIFFNTFSTLTKEILKPFGLDWLFDAILIIWFCIYLLLKLKRKYFK